MKRIQAALLISVCAMFACDTPLETPEGREKAAKQAADYVAETAKKDPTRAGKVGVWRGLHVRSQAMRHATSVRGGVKAPSCMSSTLQSGQVEHQVIRATLLGSGELLWSQKLSWARYGQLERITSIEQYGDAVTVQKGSRPMQSLWADGSRWTRSSSSGLYARDPMPERVWRRFVSRQRRAQDDLVALMGGWSRAEEEALWVSDEQGDPLRCGEFLQDDEASLSELKDMLAMEQGSLESATLAPVTLEGDARGWHLAAIWTLRRGARLSVDVTRVRRAMRDQELARMKIPVNELRAISGQGTKESEDAEE